MNELLEILAQFGGGRDDPSNLPVRFLLPAFFWAVLAYIALRQWIKIRESKDLYIGLAALAGISREMLMFVAEYGGWRGYISFDSLYLFFPPIEHAATMLSGVLVGYAFIHYVFEWRKFSAGFLTAGVGSIALLYAITAPLWVSFLREHPGALFGSFWGDMAYRVCASILMGTALTAIFLGHKTKRRVSRSLFLAFIFLFLDEFLMIFNLATAEVARTTFAPIRHNLHIWAIPCLVAVYWSELNRSIQKNEERFAELNACFLNFGDDANENIRQLTTLSGVLLGGDFAVYSRYKEGSFYAAAQWQAPHDFDTGRRINKYICCKSLLDCENDIAVIRDLPKAGSAGADHNTGTYKAGVCMGKAVRDRGTVTGTLCVSYTRDFSPDNMDRRIMGIITSAIAVEERRNLAWEKLRRSENQLRALSAYLQTVREKERIAIAREIHDELGQMLTAFKMDLFWLQKRLGMDQPDLTEKTKSMLKITDMAIQTVQKVSSDLRPSVLDDLGILAAVEWQSREFEDRTHIRSEVVLNVPEMNIPRNVATALFRIYQESLTNVARHAEASWVGLHLDMDDEKVLMKIRDNGRGIHKEHIHDPASLGLMGMRERAYSLGGDVKINGETGRGTEIVVHIPVGVQETVSD